MRCRTLYMALVAAVCCLFICQRAEAGAYTETHIYQDDYCDCVYGYAEMYADYWYNEQNYYYPSLSATLYGPAGYVGGYDSGEGETYLVVDYLDLYDVGSYDDGDYEIDAESYMYYDGPSAPYDPQRLDYWMLFTTDAPDFFDFYDGPYDSGTPVGDLGEVHSKKPVVIPHHLKVIADDTTTTSCGSADRYIRFQVVNRWGTPVTRTISDGESYTPVTNSCNGATVSPTACSPDTNGTFTDHVSVQCPSSGGSCGFDVTSVWSWCYGSGRRKALATIVYSVHHDQVLADGNTRFQLGTEIYP
jgi:hypothetical protein